MTLSSVRFKPTFSPHQHYLLQTQQSEPLFPSRNPATIALPRTQFYNHSDNDNKVPEKGSFEFEARLPVVAATGRSQSALLKHITTYARYITFRFFLKKCTFCSAGLCLLCCLISITLLFIVSHHDLPHLGFEPGIFCSRYQLSVISLTWDSNPPSPLSTQA